MPIYYGISNEVPEGTILWSGNKAFSGHYSLGALSDDIGPEISVGLNEIKNGIKIKITNYIFVTFGVMGDSSGNAVLDDVEVHDINIATNYMPFDFSKPTVIEVSKNELVGGQPVTILETPFSDDEFFDIHKIQGGKTTVRIDGKKLIFSFKPNDTSVLTDSGRNVIADGTMAVPSASYASYYMIDSITAY